VIIVEGCDNSGKTTLAKKFAKGLKLGYVKSPGPDANYDWWMKELTLPPDKLAYSVYDRFYYSELVYGPILREGIRLVQHQREVIESMLLTAEPLVVLCNLRHSKDEFHNRDQILTWEENLQAANAYKKLLIHRAIFTEEHSPASLMNAARGHVQQKAGWLKDRKRCPYGRGSMYKPDLMIVGQNFSRNNRWKVPFERSRSGRVLHTILRRYGVPFNKVWFTNAIKEDGTLNERNLAALSSEMEVIQPKTVLALGSKASGMLSVLGIEHFKIKHPGFFLRKFRLMEALEKFGEEWENLQLTGGLTNDEFRRRTDGRFDGVRRESL